jgi:hypothetical protein
MINVRCSCSICGSSWRPLSQSPEEESLERIGSGRRRQTKASLPFNDLIEEACKHVVVASAQMRKAMLFQERLSGEERGTPVAVSEGLCLSYAMREQSSCPDDAFRS